MDRRDDYLCGNGQSKYFRHGFVAIGNDLVNRLEKSAKFTHVVPVLLPFDYLKESHGD